MSIIPIARIVGRVGVQLRHRLLTSTEDRNRQRTGSEDLVKLLIRKVGTVLKHDGRLAFKERFGEKNFLNARLERTAGLIKDCALANSNGFSSLIKQRAAFFLGQLEVKDVFVAFPELDCGIEGEERIERQDQEVVGTCGHVLGVDVLSHALAHRSFDLSEVLSVAFLAVRGDPFFELWQHATEQSVSERCWVSDNSGRPLRPVAIEADASQVSFVSQEEKAQGQDVLFVGPTQLDQAPFDFSLLVLLGCLDLILLGSVSRVRPRFKFLSIDSRFLTMIKVAFNKRNESWIRKLLVTCFVSPVALG